MRSGILDSDFELGRDQGTERLREIDPDAESEARPKMSSAPSDTNADASMDGAMRRFRRLDDAAADDEAKPLAWARRAADLVTNMSKLISDRCLEQAVVRNAGSGA